MNPILNIAQKIAIQAGKSATYFASRLDKFTIEQKSDKSLVTDIDRKIEREIVQALQQVYPQHAFWGEEIGLVGDVNSPHRWYIDPIDGTTNYLQGIPHYAVSLAYTIEDKPQASVVYNPAKEELFMASKGEGATLNGKRIRLSPHSGKLHEALIATGFPQHATKLQEQYLMQFNQLLFQTRDIRRFGAASLDLCYVAAGYFNGFWELDLKPWDIAGGMLLVTEAGGLVTDLQGNDDCLHKGQIVAAAPKLLKPLLMTLNAANKSA